MDDNPFNLFTLRGLLNNLGIDSDEASNGEEALKLLKESNENMQFYDLIFMDIIMPVQNGCEITKIAREMFKKREIKHLPLIIAVTGNEKDSYDSNLFDGTASKPITTESLAELFNRFG